MLSFIFGFNIRIGRLHYFLATIVLAAGMTAISFAIAGHLLEQLPRGAKPHENDLLTWPVIAAGLFFMWVTFNLQAMRIRDIGGDPVCVIPGWITVIIIDNLIAQRVPNWAIGLEHHETIVGGVVNLVLLTILIFWPGNDNNSRLAEGPRGTAIGLPKKTSRISVPAARIAQATRSDFGRRS